MFWVKYNKPLSCEIRVGSEHQVNLFPYDVSERRPT